VADETCVPMQDCWLDDLIHVCFVCLFQCNDL
jgi:hypothetical protein